HAADLLLARLEDVAAAVRDDIARRRRSRLGPSAGVDRPGLAGAGGDEPGLVGEGDELGAVVAVELGEDASDVGLGGERADHQPAGDVGVAEAGGDKLEDLA